MRDDICPSRVVVVVVAAVVVAVVIVVVVDAFAIVRNT